MSGSAVGADEKRIQEARLRRAWHAVKHLGTIRETDKSRNDTADLDDLLDEASLRDVKTEFWKRYKLRFPTEVMPADALISRCFRETSRRMLTVFPIWKAKSLMYQVTTTQKRKRLADSLYVMEDEENERGPRTCDKYLDHLYTYLLALSIAGAGKAPGAPVDPETLGAESAKYVLVPLDIVHAYFWGARRASQLVPENARLSWLERMDVAERASWVSEFRDSSLTLGEVIRQTTDKRDAHWIYTPEGERAFPSSGHSQQRPNAPREQGAPQRPSRGDRKRKQQDDGPGGSQQEQQQRRVATKLRDGKQLCPDFQTNNCSTGVDRCAKGDHRCGAVERSGRVCGMPNHGASQCRKTR